MLTDEVKDYIQRSVLCWLATVDAQGCPNVSPKEVFAADGDSGLLIANIASPESVRNIRSNPNACVSFVDIFVQKGFKLRGHANVIEKTDPHFNDLIIPLSAITKGIFPIHNIICLEVSHVAKIIAPGYRLISGTTEDTQIKNALSRYGVSKNS